MTSREKVLTALDHRPGPVPIDFGATAVSGMHVSVVAALRDHYGLDRRPVKVCEPYQMLGLIEDDLAAAIGIDTAGVVGTSTLFGYRNEGWKAWRTPWGQEVLVGEGFRTTTAENDDVLIYPEGDTAAPPSGRMPTGGYFFDTIIRQQPFDEENPDPEDNLEEFGPMPDEEVEHFRRQTEHAMTGGKCVVATFGGTGLGDIALVPAPFMKHPKGIRDVTEWYVSTVTRQEFIHRVFSREIDIALENLERIRRAVGDNADVAMICGTDFGTQSSTFCSAETFQSLYAPYYKRVNDWIHEHTRWRTFKHSCGAVEPFLPLFADAGFDIINPVQCSAAGMDPQTLKDRHGDRLVFWGGGVDTQKTLPFGTPAQVRDEVLQRCRIFSKDGGFVFNAIHNVQAKTPVENVVAMIEAVHEFNG